MKYTFSSSLGFLTGKLSRITAQMLEKRFRKNGISITLEQWRVLAMLSAFDGASVTAIAQNLWLSVSSVSRQVKLLTEMGLVYCTRNEHDFKQKNVYLTETGKICDEHCCKCGEEVLNVLRASMPDEKELDFVNIISFFIDNAQLDINRPMPLPIKTDHLA